MPKRSRIQNAAAAAAAQSGTGVPPVSPQPAPTPQSPPSQRVLECGTSVPLVPARFATGVVGTSCLGTAGTLVPCAEERLGKTPASALENLATTKPEAAASSQAPERETKVFAQSGTKVPHSKTSPAAAESPAARPAAFAPRRAPKRPPAEPPPPTAAPMRLQKFLSQAGVCSRRTAEELILNDVIRVNGDPATLGQSVTPGQDEVRVNGDLITIRDTKRVVLLLNKPRGYLCTNSDPAKGRTVFELVPPEYADRKLFCVGRLDKDSEGMLLITDDGDFANRVIHPSGGILKRYRVTVNRPFDPLLIPRLLKGARDGDDFLRFHRVLWDKLSPDRLEIHLQQGRKREIRRLLEIFGFYVKTLFRFQIGSLVLRKMPLGDCRKLTQKELTQLLAP